VSIKTAGTSNLNIYGTCYVKVKQTVTYNLIVTEVEKSSGLSRCVVLQRDNPYIMKTWNFANNRKPTTLLLYLSVNQKGLRNTGYTTTMISKQYL